MSIPITPEEWEALWQRSKGICECGCDKRMMRTLLPVSNRGEAHHCCPKGMGGRPKHHYELWEYRMLRLDCHDKEEAAGYPHRESWIQEMNEKEGL
jgi:hypothetical protein